jgi:hypothetical protein
MPPTATTEAGAAERDGKQPAGDREIRRRHHNLRSCPCFACALRRRALGRPGLPIVIGRRVIPAAGG